MRFAQHAAAPGSSAHAALQYVDPGSHGVGSGAGCTISEHVEECELDAMEAVLRFCYTGQLCEGSDDDSQLKVGYLVQMVVLADRFDVACCTRRCLEELHGRCAAEYDMPAINAVLALPATILSLPDCTAVTAAVSERLLQLLGDADDVCDASYDSACNADAVLQQAGHAALLLLLQSDKLKAVSENSVLMMADAWVSGSAGAACSAAQLRQVAEALRLGQLSYVFLYDVLPDMAWMALQPAELDLVKQYSAAGAIQREGLASSNFLEGPAAWFSTTSRAAPSIDNLSMQLDVTQSELQALLRQQALPEQDMDCSEDMDCSDVECDIQASRQYFWNGFTFRMVLCVLSDRCTFIAIKVSVQRAQRRVAFKVARCDALLSTRVNGKVMSCRWNHAVKGGSVALGLDLEEIPSSDVLDIRSWSPYFVDDKLTATCVISECS